MKAGHDHSQAVRLLDWHNSTISRKLRRSIGSRAYRPKQAGDVAAERSQLSRNAYILAPWIKEKANALLRLQWSPEKVASKLPLSHETLYQHVYAEKALGGDLWKCLRCQNQKRKRYASGRNRRGRIPNRRLLGERPAHIKGRKQIGNWECGTVSGASHKKAIVAVCERNSAYPVIAECSTKTVDLVGQAIMRALTPFKARVKTLTDANAKDFCGHALIDEALKSTGYIARPYANLEQGTNEIFNGLPAKLYQRSAR